MTTETVEIHITFNNRADLTFECNLDDPGLKDLCQGYAKRDQPGNELLCLEIAEHGSDKPGKVIFTRRSISSLHSSAELPKQYFESVQPNPKIKSVQDYLHLNMDRQWIDWGVRAVNSGMPSQDVFKIMHDGGMPFEDIAELLEYRPERMPEMTVATGSESIHPMAKPEIDCHYRLPIDQIEIYLIPDFLSESQCMKFESLLTETPDQPGVVGETVADSSRTGDSHIYPIRENAHPYVSEYQKRVCSMLKTPVINAEPLRCQVYGKNRHYRAHVDYVYKPELESYECIDGKSRTGQREWTVIVYLRDGEAGSGTWFSKLKKEFHPPRGTALVWRNIYPSGNLNPYTIHAALPVKSNKKLVLTQWVRNNP